MTGFVVLYPVEVDQSPPPPRLDGATRILVDALRQLPGTATRAGYADKEDDPDDSPLWRAVYGLTHDVAVALAEAVEDLLDAEVDGPVRVGSFTVDLDGAVGHVLADDLEPLAPPAPAAALLPTLGSTTMGWKERDWYLGPHATVLFDRNGNAGPTVWWDGRVVGGWSQRKDGEIVFRLLEEVGADGVRAVEAEAERLASWLGDVRLAPGFLPPFQRSLSA